MRKVNIKGEIISNDEAWIYEWFDMEATSPKSVQKELDAAGMEDIEVLINSPGGSVFAGSEIYATLKEYKGNVTVKILGLAASSASVIAMAGNKILMAPTAQMMIHNVSAVGRGDYRSMEHTAEILKNSNKTIASAYMLKSGMEESVLLEMMDKETWMTAQRALELGLIDEVMFENNTPSLVANAFSSKAIPSEVIAKVRNIKHLIQPTGTLTRDNPSAILVQENLKAKLQLLKLKGGTIQ